MFEALGMVGIGLSVVAYLPQVRHLAKEHCSAGVSPRAWAMWLASSLLVGALAVYRWDYVFISLAASSLLASTAILLLARRYRGMACGTHRYPMLQPPTQMTANPRNTTRHDPRPPSHNPPKELLH